MEKEFVPYEQALALKELGFDEPCLGYFHPLYKKLVIWEKESTNSSSNWVSAPTFSQAFRWFREKYKIFPYTYTGNGNLFHYCMFIKDRDNQYHSNQLYLSNEEAELECLKKLIEIVKDKK